VGGAFGCADSGAQNVPIAIVAANRNIIGRPAARLRGEAPRMCQSQ